jgi:hypothetical protein
VERCYNLFRNEYRNGLSGLGLIQSEPVAYRRVSKSSTAETAIDLVDLKSQSKNYNDGMVSTKLFPFVAVLWFFLWAWLLLGVLGPANGNRSNSL